MTSDLETKIQQYYGADGREAARLRTRSANGRVEYRRVQSMLRSRLAPGSRILDVGGATGIHAAWLAADGHDVVLVDPVPEQVALAAQVGTFRAEVGDARHLSADDASYDAVCLFGPLYHLPTRAERVQALGEALRVLRPGGTVYAAAISRTTAFLDSLLGGGFALPDEDVEIMRTGDWTNPGEGFPGGHFHLASELREEVAAAGFADVSLWGIEAPTTLALELIRTEAPDVEDAAFRLAEAVEQQALVAGRDGGPMVDLCAHFMAIGTRPA